MADGQRRNSDDPARRAREARLAAALRANMKRRKAQARARAGSADRSTSHESAGFVQDNRSRQD
jgi:hypothetical protein